VTRSTSTTVARFFQTHFTLPTSLYVVHSVRCTLLEASKVNIRAALVGLGELRRWNGVVVWSDGRVLATCWRPRIMYQKPKAHSTFDGSGCLSFRYKLCLALDTSASTLLLAPCSHSSLCLSSTPLSFHCFRFSPRASEELSSSRWNGKGGNVVRR
jgi:hypothetical protein